MGTDFAQEVLAAHTYSSSFLYKVWFGLLLFNGTFSTNRLYRATEVQCISHRAGEQHNHTIEQWNNRI